MKNLILLDRDGVINEHRSDYVRKFEDFQWIKGSKDAMKQMIQAGLALGIVSNQAGVGKGLIDKRVLKLIENKILSEVSPSDSEKIKFFYCFHLTENSCQCRKPKPGNLIKAMHAYQLTSEETIFIGDNITDFFAAKAAGVDFYLVRTGLGAQFECQLSNRTTVLDNLEDFTKNYFGEINVC